MADIFTSWQIKNLSLENRLVRSATWEGLADAQGAPTPDTVNLTAELAEGQAGLIITGFAFVSQQGRALAKQTGAHMDAMIGPLTRISDAVHKHGGKVCLQIAHAGGQTTSETTGLPVVGPSPYLNPVYKSDIQQLSEDQITDIVASFALAAGRAQAAGFDAVQLHGAHGYLLNQFLSPNTNRRQDIYGGDLTNRARFMLEVYEACRQVVGPGFPILIKLNSHDGLDSGLEMEDAVQTAAWLDERGIDAIEVSGGTPAAGKLSPARVVKNAGEEAYFLDNAKAIKEAVSCPVMVVGGFRSREVIEDALDRVDAVALARPFIRQPHLARLWRDGDQNPATCISCGRCFIVARKQGVGCAQEMNKEDKDAKRPDEGREFR